MRKALAGPLLLVGSTALMLLVLEGAARILLHFRGPLDGGTTLADYGEYDPLLGWRKKPLSQVTFRRYEYATHLRINSHSLRGAERDYETPPNTFRILALGDSYVEGFTVEEEQTVSARLEASLARGSCRVEVLNGGTTGYSTDQEYLFYTSEGERYSPAVVVLFFYYNDILANNEQQVFGGGTFKPIFVFRDGELQLYKNPVTRPKSAPAAAPPPAKAPASALVAWVQQRLWFGAPTLYNSLGRLGLWRANRPLGAPMELRVYQKDAPQRLEDAWKKTEALLARLARDVEAHASHFVLAYVPNNMEFDDEAWRLGQVRYRIDEKDWDRSLVEKRVLEIGEKEGFPVLDLTAALRSADQTGGHPFFPYDGHWNARGHSVAAAEVEAFLGKKGWLPPCAGAR